MVVPMIMTTIRAMHMRCSFDGNRHRFAGRSGVLMFAVIVSASWAMDMSWLTVCRIGVSMIVLVSVLMFMLVPVVMSVSMGAMVVTASSVSATFGLERFVGFSHGQVHGAQHVCQHVIGLDLEVIWLQLDLHVAVAQVISRTRQVKR